MDEEIRRTIENMFYTSVKTADGYCAKREAAAIADVLAAKAKQLTASAKKLKQFAYSEGNRSVSMNDLTSVAFK